MEIVSKTLTQIKIFWLSFREITIFRKFEQNQHFWKFWPKSRILWILTKIKSYEKIDKNRENLRQLLTKFDNLKILAKIKIEDQSRIPRILTESRFSKILTRIEIFQKFRPKSRFLKILTKIEIFQKNWTEIVSKTMTKIEISLLFFSEIMIFLKFWTKSRLSQILTEFGIIKTFDKIWHNFRIFFTKIEIFESLGSNQDFSKTSTNAKIFKKFWRKSIFSENLEQSQHFWKFWPKLRKFTIVDKIR